MSLIAVIVSRARVAVSSTLWIRVATIAWLGAASAGLFVLLTYENAPGAAANAPARWPEASVLVHTAGRPTLLLLAHPQCSCTPASLAELAEVLARAHTRPRTYVLFIKPQGFSNEWVTSDLWKTAAAIPGVTLVRDEDGQEARRFGSATSGQTLLYDSTGVLRFSGGITGSRSHSGDNAGRQSLVALLSGAEPTRTATSVFGCPLFASGL
ncbi:MAG: RedB protein [Vicinamibacterales bacterium]